MGGGSKGKSVSGGFFCVMLLMSWLSMLSLMLRAIFFVSFVCLCVLFISWFFFNIYIYIVSYMLHTLFFFVLFVCFLFG